MWIAFPVTINCPLFGSQWAKEKEDFFRDAPAISRSFSNYGRPGFNLTKTFRLAQHSSKALDGYVYSMRGIGAIAILKFPHDSPASLVRPNVASTLQILGQLGLNPNATLVTETIAARHSNQGAEKLRFNVSMTASDDFIFDELYPRFLCAIAAERMILDLSVTALNSQFLSTRRARTLSSFIKYWNSHPAIESAQVRAEYQTLRNALDLDNRAQEILESLEAITKRGNTALIASTASAAALLSLQDSESLWFTQTPMWPLGGLAAGIAIWALIRGTRS